MPLYEKISPRYDLSMKRIGIFRCDRIGDVINALPVARLFKQKWPNCHVTFVSNAYAHEVVTLCPDVDEAVFLQEGRIHKKCQDLPIHQFMKEGQFDWVCNLFLDAKSAFQIWKASKGARILGPRSKWYTWLFYTDGLRQRRSQRAQHETQYNQDLVPEFKKPYLRPRLTRPEPAAISEPAILWHPCCGGHALHLSAECIIELFKSVKVQSETTPIIFCGIESERQTLEGIVKGLRYIGPWPVSVQVFSSLKTYAQHMLAHRLWVGPSTGPMHLAAAMDVPLMTYFSPIGVQHPRRWGPFETSGLGSSVWLPPHSCPSRHDCLEERCPSFTGKMPDACLSQLITGDFLACVFKTADKIRLTI